MDWIDLYLVFEELHKEHVNRISNSIFQKKITTGFNVKQAYDPPDSKLYRG